MAALDAVLQGIELSHEADGRVMTGHDIRWWVAATAAIGPE